MSLEKIGLGALLLFDADAALTKIGKVNAHVARLHAGMQNLGRGARQMAGGVGQIAGALTPAAVGASIATGIATKSLFDFDTAVSKIGAVLGSAEFNKRRGEIEALSKDMAIAFPQSASEAAGALEMLVRAGVTGGQQWRDILPAALSLSTAEMIDTRDAMTGIVSAINTFQLGSGKASEVADMLARTSAAANTDVLKLGESLKYGGQKAAMAQVPLSQTLAMFGAMADIGLTDSTAGVSLTNMITQMTDKQGAKLLAKLGVAATDAAGKFRPLPIIVDEVHAALARVSNEEQRFQLASQIFGERGVRAYHALATKGSAAVFALEKTIAQGSASVADKANLVMHSLGGLANQIKGSLGVVAIEFMQSFAPGMSGGLEATYAFVNEVAQALRILRDDPSLDASSAKLATFGGTARSVALGLSDAIGTVRETFGTIKETILDVGAQFGLSGEDIVRSVTKGVAVFAMVAPAMLPIAGAAFVVKGALGGVFSILGGAKTMILGVAQIFAGGLGGALSAVTSRLGPLTTVGGRLMGLLGGPWALGIGAAVAVLGGMSSKAGEIWERLKALGEPLVEVGKAFGELGQAIWTELKPVVSALGNAFGELAEIVGTGLVEALKFAKAFLEELADDLRWLAEQIPKIGQAVRDAKGWMDGIIDAPAAAMQKIENARIQAKILMLSPEEKAAIVQQWSQFGSSLLGAVVPVARAYGDEIARAMNPTAAAAVDTAVGLIFRPGETGMALIDDISKTANATLTPIIAAARERLGAIGAGLTKAVTDAQASAAANVKIDLKNCLTVDGTNLNVAGSRAQLELSERAGAQVTPYQRRAIVERGAALSAQS